MTGNQASGVAAGRRRRGMVLVTVGAALAALVAALALRPGADTPVIGPTPSEAATTAPTPTATPTNEGIPTTHRASPVPVDVVDELHPPPIPARSVHSVVSDGERMLVVGGSRRIEDSGPVPPDHLLADGAVYDPRTSAWERLPDAPAGIGNHLAAWTGAEMVVAGGDPDPRGLLRYDPATRRWTVGTPAPFDIHRDDTAIAWTGAHVVVWSPGHGIGAYDPDTDAWRQPSPPPVDPPDAVSDTTYALHAHGDLLYALAGGIDSPVQVAIRHADGSWTRGEDIGARFGTFPDGERLVDPQLASLTVATDAGLLAVSRSSDTIPAALLDPEDGTWSDLAVPGIPSCEWYPPPLAIPSGAVVFNSCGEGALFDAAAREFTPTAFPLAPPGSADTTVWTGQGLVTYATACCWGSASTTPHMGSWHRPLS